MDGYNLRAYREEDLPRMKEITGICFKGVSVFQLAESLLGRLGDHDWKELKCAAIATHCRIQPDGVFVAEGVDGDVVGYVTSRLETPSLIGWIADLAVDPAHQGQGLGRALLERAIHFFRENGMKAARIETLAHNPVGQHLYPSLGFREVTRQIHYAMRLDDIEAAE